MPGMFPLLFNLIPTTMMPLYVQWKCQAWREAKIHCHNYFNERDWRRHFSAICQQKAVTGHPRLHSHIKLNAEFFITAPRSTAFVIFPGSLWSLKLLLQSCSLILWSHIPESETSSALPALCAFAFVPSATLYLQMGCRSTCATF